MKTYMHPKICMWMLIAGLFITSKIEPIQMSINWQMEKQIVTAPYNELTLKDKKEWSEWWYNIDETQKQYAKKKKKRKEKRKKEKKETLYLAGGLVSRFWFLCMSQTPMYLSIPSKIPGLKLHFLNFLNEGRNLRSGSLAGLWSYHLIFISFNLPYFAMYNAHFFCPTFWGKNKDAHYTWV